MAHVLVQRACAKLRSVNESLVGLGELGEMINMVQFIQSKLEDIQPLLEKFEMLLLDHTLSRRWLKQVVNVPYRIMDMFDELEDARQPAATKMDAFVTKLRRIKIEVIAIMEELHSYISAEQLRQQDMDQRPEVQFFDEAWIFGRRSDKKRIVAVLLSTTSNITQAPPSCIILPIFGLPGSGKTTLAQMVFNDRTHPLQEYNFRVWVHVSPELDFHRIGESILCQVMSGGGGEKEEIVDNDSNSDVLGLEHIMKRLQKLLKRKKVLLVLDDLWEEDSIQLQLLKSMLTFLGDKVDVIVTTCNQAIARKICTAVQPYRLNPLGDDTCWEIIKKSICFEEQNEELEKIGPEIASKCWGPPSAAQAYARMLIACRDPTEWENIMERNVRHISGSTFLRTFILSYMSMPPELRLCYDYYCDIFPSGHNIVKDDLVHQWIALDFTEPSERSSATEIAEGYITKLLDMSFFQTAESDPASGNDDKGAAIFTMPDLVHGVASLMWMKFDLPSMHYMLVINCHGKLVDDRYYDDLRALRCIGCSKVEFDDGSFSSRRSLRVLELQESSVPKLPASIWQLRHLGYLKISAFTGLITLPESLGDLTNLLHIDLSGCYGLINLPKSSGKLVRLVHVNFSGCSGLVSLPESFGMLISLVHVNLSGCSGLVTLPGPIGNLISLVHINLSDCSGLVTLPGSIGNLISLVHINLSGCYGLVSLPKSFLKLLGLVHVNLSGCSRLINLPKSFGKLILLVHVNLSGCSRLINLPESFGKLILLVHVNLSGCSGLATLPESFGGLINLSHLDISRCHGLAKLPETLQKLGKLVHLDLSFWSCFEGIKESLSGLKNLEHLNLSHPCCHLPQQRSHLQGLKYSFRKLTSLRYLNLSMCLNPIFYYQSQEENLKYIGDCLKDLSQLEHLDLSHNTFLFYLPTSLGDLNRLNTLDLSGCIRLKKVGAMKSLKFIALKNCRALESCNFIVCVDEDAAAYKSSNLVQLEDVNCQELQISCLENVRSKEEARRIKLVEKQKLEKLKLSWTLGSLRSVEDSALLGEFIQPSNLQCLEINGYDGRCLPEYLGELTSLQELNMVSCKQLNSLQDSIKELTNLKVLFISGCQPLKKWCLLEENKKMLAHIPKKKYEEHGVAIVDFVVCVHEEDAYMSSSNIVQLEDVNCQDLQISCLEKVRSKEEPQRIKLVEKQKLEKLKLSWTLGSPRSVEDSALLGEFIPPSNLQCLEINGYDGTCLPEYLGNLTSLQELNMVSCK